MNIFFVFSLLIGAPRDHLGHDIITRRGAVWKCEFRFDDRCQRVPFRRDGKQEKSLRLIDFLAFR